MLSFTSPPRCETTEPSASTASTPEHLRAACRRSAARARRRRWSRSSRRASRCRARPSRRRSPSRRAEPRPARRRCVAPAPAVSCPPTGSTEPGSIVSSRRSDSTISPVERNAARRPVPCCRLAGRPRHRVARTPGSTSATSSVVPGRTTAGVVPAEPAGPVDGVRLRDRRIGQHVGRSRRSTAARRSSAATRRPSRR